MSLKGTTVVITGASRGIGRGLALGFGELGATVFITGRRAGPLEEVAGAVRAAGGASDFFVVDHADDAQIAQFFDKLAARLAADGASLDVFVNNAYAAVGFLDDSSGVPFWNKSVEKPSEADENADPGKVWDIINGVGLRNNYVCSARAMRILEKQKSGTIVNITSWGGLASVFDPVYSIGKAAVDRMAAEIALNAPKGVSCFAFCPGYVTTEALTRQFEEEQTRAKEQGRAPVQDEKLPPWNSETPLFVGRVLAALMSDKGERLRQGMQGKVVITAEVAEKLAINDENGFRPLSFRSIRFSAMQDLPFLRTSFLRFLIPRALNAPWPVIRAMVGAARFWN